MDAKSEKAISKLISLVLRHKPEELNLSMDGAGWVDAEALVQALAARGLFSMADLERIVSTDDKGRYLLDAGRIRANQEHSVNVDLGLKSAMPPEYLFHGTVAKVISAIRDEGLSSGQRAHVHLSPDRATAMAVGARRGRPIVLTIRAAAMAQSGSTFYRSANGVWLTAAVAPEWIIFEQEHEVS